MQASRTDLAFSPPTTQRSHYKDHLRWDEGVHRHYRAGDEKEGEEDEKASEEDESYKLDSRRSWSRST